MALEGNLSISTFQVLENGFTIAVWCKASWRQRISTVRLFVRNSWIVLIPGSLFEAGRDLMAAFAIFELQAIL